MWLGAWGWVMNSQQSCATQLPWFILDACRVSYGLIAFYCLCICYDVDMFISCDHCPPAICGLGVLQQLFFSTLRYGLGSAALDALPKGEAVEFAQDLTFFPSAFYEFTRTICAFESGGSQNVLRHGMPIPQCMNNNCLVDVLRGFAPLCHLLLVSR